MKTYSMYWKILAVLLITLLGYASFLGMAGSFGRPVRYEVSSPYVGWVTITYAKVGCDFLATRGLFLVIPIDQFGKSCTNSPMPQGLQFAQVFYVDKDGKETAIQLGKWGRKNIIQAWGISTHTPEESDPSFTEEWFIGTEEQLQNSWSEQPSVPSNRNN